MFFLLQKTPNRFQGRQDLLHVFDNSHALGKTCSSGHSQWCGKLNVQFLLSWQSRLFYGFPVSTIWKESLHDLALGWLLVPAMTHKAYQSLINLPACDHRFAKLKLSRASTCVAAVFWSCYVPLTEREDLSVLPRLFFSELLRTESNLHISSWDDACPNPKTLSRSGMRVSDKYLLQICRGPFLRHFANFPLTFSFNSVDSCCHSQIPWSVGLYMPLPAVLWGFTDSRISSRVPDPVWIQIDRD